MAHQQLVADVHLDELYPPNKRYDLMDANKKIDLEHVQCPPESKILMNIIKNHPLRFKLLWEGIHYSLLHSTSSIPYPKFTKIIIGHYMTNCPEIIRCARDKYHNLKDDDLMKNIFNSGRYKDKVGMKIPDWMISEEMKETKHYRMFVEVFGIDVLLIQSSPTESTQGMLRTPSKSTRLTQPALVLTVDKADELILQDTLQVSLAEHKIRQEQEARENMALVKKHLASEVIEKMVEGQEHVVDDSLIPRNDEHNIPGTRLEPRSDKESLEVGITDVTVPVNVYEKEEEEDEITNEVYKLKRMEKGKNVEESRITPFPTPIRSLRINTNLVSLDTEKLYKLTIPHTTPSSSSPTMADSLPIMVDTHIKEQVEKQVHEQVRNQVPVYVAEGLILERQKTKKEMEKMIAKVILQECGNIQAQISLEIQQAIVNDIPFQVDASDDHHDDAHPDGEKSAKRQKTSEYETYVSGESSYNKRGVTDVDEAKLKKITVGMLRQRCTSRDKHQYHIDQMKNFLKSDIVWESRKEILVSPHPRKTTPLVLRPKKIVLSLYKFPKVFFIDDDTEERTSKWVNKCVKKFNLYARYGVEHWKNPHAKIFYIRKQKEPGKPKEIIARRANDCIVLITEPDFKNLNKNDTEDMYLLIMNEKLGIKSYQQKNSKKEKRVMRHSEIHKFCDATLNRVLEGLKIYNNDVRYGYNQRDPTKHEVEYLKLFEEDIEDRLKYRRQMRR
nr:hypothetical protein [Tanacetum cinerariifolium]